MSSKSFQNASNLNGIVSVLQFGAVGDGVADDTAAIQAAIDFCKSFNATGSLPTLIFSTGASKTFKITGSLNFTGIRTVGFIVDFSGCTVIGATSGKPVIDALDSQHISFKNGIFYGPDSVATPSYGIQIGRGIIGNDAPYNSLYDIQFTGSYTKACLLNAGSEIFLAKKCNFWNSSAQSNAACLIQDSKNVSHVTSEFFVVNVPQDVQQSLNDNVYLNCTFEQVSTAGASAGPSIYVTSDTNSLVFKTCYAQNALNRIVDFGSGIQTNLVLDIHCETANLVNNIKCKTSQGNVQFFSCSFVEYWLFATNSMFTTDGGSGAVHFYSCLIDVQNSSSSPIFKNNGTSIYYHGEIKIGTSGYLYNFIELSSIIGDINCKNVFTSLILPFISSVKVSSSDSAQNVFFGNTRIAGDGALYLNAGINIASASTISILPYGFEFYIEGSTTITKINCSDSDKGRIIRLVFGGSITLTNSYSNGTLLAGNFNATANQSILLYSSGTAWNEISRCLNVVN